MVFEDSSSGARADGPRDARWWRPRFRIPIETLDAAHYLIDDLTGVSVQTLPGDEGLILNFTPLSR